MLRIFTISQLPPIPDCTLCINQLSYTPKCNYVLIFSCTEPAWLYALLNNIYKVCTSVHLFQGAIYVSVSGHTDTWLWNQRKMWKVSSYVSSSLGSLHCLCFCCGVVTRRDSWSILPKNFNHAHTHTLIHTVDQLSTCCCPFWMYFITRSDSLLWNMARLVSLSPVSPHICQLGRTPTQPHASRGVTFALLFVTQNNIRSPVFFFQTSPSPFSAFPPTLPRASFAGWNKLHDSVASAFTQVLADSCGNIMFAQCERQFLVYGNHWWLGSWKRLNCFPSWLWVILKKKPPLFTVIWNTSNFCH